MARTTSWARRAPLWLVPAAAVVLAALALFADLGEDVAAGNGATSADASRLEWFVQHRSPGLLTAARDVTSLGTVTVLGVGAILAALALWWAGHRLVVAIAPGVALGVAGVAVSIGKSAFARVRPGVPVRLVADNEASFPSGHAADSAALLLTLAIVVAAFVLRRPIARALTVAAAALATGAIGLTRLLLAAHWPTDVVAGWALGTIAAVVVGSAAVMLGRVAPPTGGPLRVLWLRRTGLPLAASPAGAAA